MTAFFRRKLKGFLPRVRAFLRRRVDGFRWGNLAGFQAKKPGRKDASKLFEELIGVKLIEATGRRVGCAHELLLHVSAHGDLGLAAGAPSGGVRIGLYCICNRR